MARAVVLIATLLAFVVGAWFVWSTYSAERREAAFRAKGYPTTLTELNEWYERPPDGENAADYYMKAGNQIAASNFPEWDQVPIFGAHSENSKLGVLGEEVSEEDLQRTAAFLLYHEEAYELMAEAARFEGSRYPVDYTAGPALGIDHFSVIRSVWRALLLKTYYHCARDEVPDAIATFEQLAHVVNSLDEEPSSHSVLVRIALLQGVTAASEYLLNSVTLSEEACTSMDRALLSLTDNEHVLRAAVGDRCFDDGYLKTMTGLTGVFARFVRDDYREVKDTVIEVAEKPYPDSIPEWILLNNRDSEKGILYEMDAFTPWMQYLPPPGTGFWGYSMLSQLHSHGRIAAARAALQIERARASGHAIPSNIMELPDDVVADWPRDPFTGEPIRYKRLPSGYVTYSVGQNLSDDGGIDENLDVEDLHWSRAPDAAFRILK